MKVKTHLIVTDQWDEYSVKWIKRLVDVNPKLDSYGYPTFYLVSNNGRVEVKTFDMAYLVRYAKNFTRPKGRGSCSTDKGLILILEEQGETLMATVEHNHFRKYAPMYDEL